MRRSIRNWSGASSKMICRHCGPRSPNCSEIRPSRNFHMMRTSYEPEADVCFGPEGIKSARELAVWIFLQILLEIGNRFARLDRLPEDDFRIGPRRGGQIG